MSTETESAPSREPQDSDPLLSVIEVARHIGHTVEATAALVVQGAIPSVDGGQLAARGRLDVGVVRKSRLLEAEAAWATGLTKRIDTHAEHGLHPAAISALTFFDAVARRDDELVAFLSTERTRDRAQSDRQLRRLWKRKLSSEVLKKAGIASGVYPYPDEPGAVIIRLVWNPGPVSYIVKKATPLNSPGLLPLIREDGFYRADLTLFERQEDLRPHAGLAESPSDN